MRTRTIARWRRAALGSTLALALAFPGGARAQQGQDPAPAQQDQPPLPAPQEQAAPSQEKAAEPQQGAPAQRENAPTPVTEESARPAPDANVQPVPGTPDEYTIQKGDTLWDLSQKFLNNPWYWPKIWSLNPSIENPHWIYPGNKLRIVPGEGGAQAPAQVAEEQAPGIDASANSAPEEPAPGADPVVAVSPPATPDLDVISKGSRESEAALSSVSVSGKLSFTPPPVVSVRSSGLVSPEELRASGTLEASFEEREMLATYDTAYARFKDEVSVKPGDKLLIFRPEADIVDPVSHRTLARQTKTVGVAKVLSIDGQQATVQIERTFEEMERGDRVRLWSPEDKRIAPRPNTVDLRGRIVQALNSGLTTYGEAHQVFINRGSADGVQEGNTFAVVRHGDGLNNVAVTQSYTAGAAGARAASVETPPENVGLLLVVDTHEHLSTALVVKSVRELQAGDVVEMHASGSGGGIH